MADNPKSPDICVLCKKPLVEGEMVFRERGGDLVKHQVCPPKSLASLADELEGYAQRIGIVNPALTRTLRDAAAALRAPTIAADDARQVAGDDAALVARLNVVCLTLYDSEEAEDDPIVCGEFRRAQSTVLEAAKRIANLSATPSPTIAAPSPSQSNTLDLPPCPVCGETLVTRYSGPLPTNPSHASQPPQPSPSNEPAVEWVMCAIRDTMREHNFVVERGSDLWNRLRRHIEAALNGWHDGAGQ